MHQRMLLLNLRIEARMQRVLRWLRTERLHPRRRWEGRALRRRWGIVALRLLPIIELKLCVEIVVVPRQRRTIMLLLLLLVMRELRLSRTRIIECLLRASLAQRIPKLRDLVVGNGVSGAELALGHEPPFPFELFAVLVRFGCVGQGRHGRKERCQGGDLGVEVFPLGGAVAGFGVGCQRGDWRGGGGDVPGVVAARELGDVFGHGAKALDGKGWLAARFFCGLWGWCWGWSAGILTTALAAKVGLDVCLEAWDMRGRRVVLVIVFNALPH